MIDNSQELRKQTELIMTQEMAPDIRLALLYGAIVEYCTIMASDTIPPSPVLVDIMPPKEEIEPPESTEESTEEPTEEPNKGGGDSDS